MDSFSGKPAASDLGADSALEALFERARQSPPTDAQLAHLLRSAHQPPSRARRVALRLTAAALAAAAVIAAAVLLIAPPGQPSALALADIAAAMRRVETVKTISADGSIHWSCPNRIGAYVKRGGKEAAFSDFQSCEIASYSEESGCIMLSTSDRRSDFPKVVPSEWEYLTDLERMIYREESRGHSFEEVWNREDLVEAGRPLILLTAKDSTGKPYHKYGIDGRTGLIVWADGFPGRLSYQYPAEPPKDIYDLGVPRDAPVIDGRAGPELWELRGKVLAAMRATRDYGAYRMVTCRTGNDPMAELRVTDGRRYRYDSIRLAPGQTLSLEDLPVFAAKWIRWDLLDKTHTTAICDGTSETLLARTVEGEVGGRYVEPKESASGRTRTLFFDAWYREYGVFFPPSWSKQLEYLEPDARGRVGIRILAQADHLSRPVLTEEWYDPSHGLMHCARFSYDFPAAPWQLTPGWQDRYVKGVDSPIMRVLPDAPAQGNEMEVLQWAQFREGQWYPQLRRTRHVVQAENGAWVERAESPYVDGFVAYSQIVRPDPEKAGPRKPKPGVTYHYILAEPLDEVRDEWFEIPPQWADVPLRQY